MNNDEDSQTAAQAKQDEAIFFVRVIRIVDQSCTFVCEDTLRLLERDAVLAGID